MLFRMLLPGVLAVWQSVCLAQSFAPESVLSTGAVYKMAVQEDAVYKIDKAFLLKLGLSAAELDPRGIQIYSGHPDLLPQENAGSATDDLRQVPSYRYGLADGSFDAGDYILFFGKGPDSRRYDPGSGHFSYTQHLYSRKNYYFIRTGTGNGSSVDKIAYPAAEPLVKIITFNDIWHHEENLKNLIRSGREWVGAELNDREALSVNIPVREPAATGDAYLEVSVVSAVEERSVFEISLGGKIQGRIAVSAAQGTAYGHKAIEKTASFSVPMKDFQENAKLQIKHIHSSTTSGYLNYLNLQMLSKLRYPGSQFLFRAKESLGNNARYSIGNATAKLKVWEVSDPFGPLEMDAGFSGSELTFVAPGDKLREFVVFDPAGLNAPEPIGKLLNQNLHATPTPDLLIITHGSLREEAERLAGFRRSNDGLEVKVVATEEVYNEFSSGKQDVSALRNFIRMLYLRNQKLSYVLLFGDASYDYLSDGAENTNIVPAYQSKTSFHNVHSYASDDFFGFLEEHEGSWEEEGNMGNHTLEVAVGRLPVQTAEEARNMVNKLIHYTLAETIGDWRLRTLFVADDGDANKHQHQSNFLSVLSEESDEKFTANRLFTDAFPKVRDRFGLSAPAMREALQQQIERGALLVDYIGHGSETVWANERILDLSHIEAWENKDKMPVFLTATCEFGRFDDPGKISGAEKMLLRPSGGAIGLLTSTRPVFPNTSFDFSQAFYQTAFEDGLLHTGRLGDIFLHTKNRSIAGTTNRNFSLLGDPSMRLAVPAAKVVLETINGKQVLEKDSLHPLQKVRLKGHVENNGGFDPSFTGKMQITLWGAYTEKQTLGYEGEHSVFNYRNRENILYSGLVSLKEGRFDAEILLPELPDKEFRNCKLVFYAFRDDMPVDGAGAHAVVVGGEPDEAEPDADPPLINLWMENKNFVNGGEVPVRPVLIAEFSDASGILLHNDAEQGIRLVIDGKEDSAVVVSSWYQAKQDTYREGSLRFQLGTLKEGMHELSLSASDTRGNRSEERIRFVVSGQAMFFVSPVRTYPNPSSGEVTFDFGIGGSMEAAGVQEPGYELLLYAAEGKVMLQKTDALFPDSEGYFQLKLDLRDYNIPSGMYFYKLQLGPANAPAMLRSSGRIIYYR